MTERTNAPRTWRFPRPLVEDQLMLAGMIWVGFVITVLAVIFGIDRWSQIQMSIWEQASKAIPWYVAFMSGYVMYQVIPMYVAHGKTRRDATIEWGIFAGLFAVLAAVLSTIGYALEWFLYWAMAWPHELDNEHFSTSDTAFGMMLIEALLQMVVWSAAGGLVGACVYRSSSYGWVALLPAGLLVSLSGVGTDAGPFAFVMGLLPDVTPDLLLAFPLAVIGAAVALAGLWVLMRDMPIVKR